MAARRHQERTAGRDDRSRGAPPSRVPSLPHSTHPGPVRLRVGDRARSEAFYRRVLGLERREGGEGWAALGAAGGERPLVELVERPGVRPLRPRSRLGLYHFALLLPDRAVLGRFGRHAVEAGLRPGASDHAVSEALYLTDPDGLGIEVYRDRPRSRWRTIGDELVMKTRPLDLEGLIEAGGDEPFDGLPPETVVGHVHLHVGDLGDASRFYHEALGLDVTVRSYPGALFLSAGGYHHHLGVNTWAGDAPPAGPEDAGLVAWSLVVPTEGDVDRVRGRLEDAGADVRTDDFHGGTVAIDPCGTALEVVAEGQLRPRPSA